MSNYREELEKLTDEELLKKYKYVREMYDWWSTSDDGSEGAYWDYEGQPVVDELKKRGIDYRYELERMEIYDYLDGEIKKSEHQLMDLNCSNYKHIQRDINNERKKIELLKTIKNDLKALDIIKKREIDAKDITDTTNDYDLYVAYCEGKGYAEDYICSQDEFELLRKVLVYDK